MIQHVFTIAIALVAAALAQEKEDNGPTIIAGRVETAAKEAVPGSFVWLVREPSPDDDLKKFVGEAQSVTTDSLGYFGFFGLKRGRYKLCASPEHVDHWANCQWGEAPTHDLTKGEMRYGVSVIVGRAVRMRVIIKDESGLRAKAKDDEKDPMTFAVLLLADGKVPVPMKVERDDTEELVFTALAPGDRDLKIRVASDRGKFVEADRDGSEADAKENEFTVKANDQKSREVIVRLKAIEKVDREGKK